MVVQGMGLEGVEEVLDAQAGSPPQLPYIEEGSLGETGGKSSTPVPLGSWPSIGKTPFFLSSRLRRFSSCRALRTISFCRLAPR